MSENYSEWENVGCILCGNDAAYKVIWPDKKRGDIVRCRECGLSYRNPRRTELYLNHHFTEEWTEARPVFTLEEYRWANLKKIADWIISRQNGSSSILDIGSSYGTLLSQFPND